MLKIIYSFVCLKVKFKHNRQILESSHQITTRAHRNSLGYELELFLPDLLSSRNQWRLQEVIKSGRRFTDVSPQKLHFDFCTDLTNEM